MKFNVDAFLDSLPIMAKGMIGILLVTCAMIFTVWLLGKLTAEKKQDSNQQE